MRTASHHKMDSSQEPDEPKGHDFFVSLTVTRGPDFFDEMKHATHDQRANLLRSYAARYEGFLREVFLLMANYELKLKLNPLAETPDPNFANATGGTPTTYSFGACGGCTLANGKQGKLMSVDGKPTDDCYPC
jgi:hypothetical protein